MKRLFLIFFFLIFSTKAMTEELKMLLKLETGDVEIKLFPDIAPNHVKRFTTLAKNKKYDGVDFKRLIDGNMSKTGDHKIST